MSEAAPKYLKHILICVNERAEGHPRGSCGRCGGPELRARFVQLISDHGLKGKVRASKTYCLDACELGPVVAIYPDDVWYVGVAPEEVDAIFQQSVLADGVYAPKLASSETWEKLRALREAQKSSG
ncbi:MAG: ferredoxin [Candidatus Sericytochromatia bacterium]